MDMDALGMKLIHAIDVVDPSTPAIFSQILCVVFVGEGVVDQHLILNLVLVQTQRIEP